MIDERIRSIALAALTNLSRTGNGKTSFKIHLVSIEDIATRAAQMFSMDRSELRISLSKYLSSKVIDGDQDFSGDPFGGMYMVTKKGLLFQQALLGDGFASDGTSSSSFCAIASARGEMNDDDDDDSDKDGQSEVPVARGTKTSSSSAMSSSGRNPKQLEQRMIPKGLGIMYGKKVARNSDEGPVRTRRQSKSTAPPTASTRGQQGGRDLAGRFSAKQQAGQKRKAKEISPSSSREESKSKSTPSSS